ncbi:sodium:proline symporter [bacterium CG17_big_fil_post_rev_8_21_14_2_50_64_8]|nr:MAG: sodium:proline symporter [bacterium CG17_big_fil_post_rev_8_21_14_2_50_64_8]PJA73891.1 MAG: sodium:proline symporter [bacterium CG_4_9_14_3_um_filter_65_15]
MDSLILGMIVYSVLILAVGVYSARRNRTLDDYLLANRSLGPWVAAFSERASGESAWLLIGLPGLAFATGAGTLWVGVGCCTGIAFSWFVVARRLRVETAALQALTLADYFEARHDDHSHTLRLVATAIILFFFTFYVAAQFLAAGKVLNYYLDIPPLAGMLIGAVLVLFYTAAGGLLAVCWTDLIQGIIMLFTLAVLPLVVLVELGGTGGMMAKLAPLGGQYLDLTPGSTTWAAVSGVLGSLAIGLGYMGQPHLVLRFMAITSSDEIKKGGIIAIGWALIAFFGAILIGLTGLAWFGPGAMGPGQLIPDQEQLMPMMASHFMPEGLAVVMIVGAIAAMMSTADSQLLSVASAVSEDIYRRLINPDASQASLVALGRWSTLLVGAVAFGLAWGAHDFVYDMVLYAWAGLGAAFGPPLLLSLRWQGTSRAGVLAGLITGTVTVIAWYNIPVLKGQLYEMIPGFVLSLLATIVFSLLFPRTSLGQEGPHGAQG